jgi:hypothetical protein
MSKEKGDKRGRGMKLWGVCVMGYLILKIKGNEVNLDNF